MTMTDAELAAYGDGIDAGHCIGRYQDWYKTHGIPPECPYAVGTVEERAWLEGFSDGTEDHIAGQYV